jgi:hypothetical protein
MLKDSQCHFIVDTTKGNQDSAYCGKKKHYHIGYEGERVYDRFCPEHLQWEKDNCCPDCENRWDHCECD